MRDSFGRTIDYLRVSVTDRCDLRCVYCMPETGVQLLDHSDILSYEEILRLVGIMACLGVKKVRLTGGEPLTRKGLPALVAEIKAIPGIEQVCLTTNGMSLSSQLPELKAAGLDGVNISLDTLDDVIFEKITRRTGVNKVLCAIDDSLAEGLSVKINCVPTAMNREQIVPLAERFLPESRLSLRFIELMPIGLGKTAVGIPPATVKQMLTESFGEMKSLEKDSLSGPCSYYSLGRFPGKLGFISAVSSCFCAECNRVRLTSTGFLKTCLQFDKGVGLRPLLAADDDTISAAITAAIRGKPEHHLFSEHSGEHLEGHTMSQIGG